MAGEILELDPIDQDAANGPLTITNAALGYYLLEHSYPTPNRATQYSASVDADGDAPVSGRYENRTITLRVRVRAATSSDLMIALRNLQQKVGKIAAEGGTLKRTVPNGDVIVFDLLTAKIDVPSDQAFLANFRADCSIELIAKPFGRMAEQDLGDNTETTLPVLVFTDTAVKGDVPALGRLVIDDDQGADQFWLLWAIQSRNYSAASTAALFYQAESLTAMGSSAIAAGPSGASGSGSNVMRNTALSIFPQAILSTQATGGGDHLTHVGTFRVFARVQVPTTNTGAVTVSLEWSLGDYRRPTQNATRGLYSNSADPVAWGGTWRIVDLGFVLLPEVQTGTHQWEGRLVAKSTVTGDDIDVDWLMIAPVDEGFGIAQGVTRESVPSGLTAYDSFAHTAGALTGKTLNTGGTWQGAGDATDFQASGSNTATRTATADSAGMNNARLIVASGTSGLTDTGVYVSIRHSVTSTPERTGVIARYTDANNFVAAFFDAESTPGFMICRVRQRVASTETQIGYGTVEAGSNWLDWANDLLQIAFHVFASGRFTVSVNLLSQWVAILEGTSADLATGGTLASGKIGIFDHYTSATADTRTYTNFYGFAVLKDAAMFASQSLQIRHDGVVREDPDGEIWQPVSKYEGDHLFIPPAGRENRTARTLIKACRADPATGADSAIDDISAQLYATPRVLVVPEP